MADDINTIETDLKTRTAGKDIPNPYARMIELLQKIEENTRKAV